MKRLLLIAILLSVPGYFAPAQTELPDSLRIVVLGSSTAAGAGTSTRDSAWVWRYRAFLESLNPKFEVINLAVGGYTTWHIQPSGYTPPAGRPSPDSVRNITAALALHPSAIIINLPSNDAAKNYSIIEQTQNFETVASIAASASVPLWICTTQPRNLSDAQRQNLITMRDWIFDTYTDHSLDFWNDLAQEDGRIVTAYNSGDGVHLNDAGHAILFDRVRTAQIPQRVRQATLVAALPSGHILQLTPFPQPARNVVTFRIRTARGHRYTVLVRNLLGMEVHRFESDAHESLIFHRFDATDLPRGLYHVLLSSEGAFRAASLLLIH